jgi:NTP pyrophosphatase (non-canonical NTP hydrolase)
MVIWVTESPSKLKGHWTYASALQEVMEGAAHAIQVVDLQPLIELVNQYYAYRKYVDPNADRALKFLYEELGELSGAIVAEEHNWVRNNPDRERNSKDESGDALMMLTKLCEKLGFDPIQAMVDKFATKGFEREA